MKTLYSYYSALILLMFTASASAQYIQVNDTYTAQQLVQALVGSSCAQVSNITINGSPDTSSYGYFTSGTSSFPFANGIVLSTGYARSAPGPNNSLLSEGSTAWLGDNDLEAALNVNNTINATVLEFDFIPFTDRISFDYIFSSEQYLTSVTSQAQCNYTDGFAFLLKEAGSTGAYQNLAVVPGTNIPVKVNTVRGVGACPTANEQYFGGFNGSNHPTNYNGQTVVLKAQSNVTAGTLYHIKLVVADQGNNLYDSAIFLGGGSFNASTTLGPDVLNANNDGLCAGETLTLNAFSTLATNYQWFLNNTAIPGENNATYIVTAEGDYSVEVTLGATCTSEGSIRVEYAVLPASNQVLLQCDEDGDGLTTFNLTTAGNAITTNEQGLAVTYYTDLNDANAGTGFITDSEAFDNTVLGQVVFARVENLRACYTISEITLQTSANGVTNPTPLQECDEDGTDDGLTSFDLTQRDAEILQGLPANLQLQYFTSREDALQIVNPIPNPANFTTTVQNTQTVYARIFNGSECYGIAELQLNVFSFGTSFDDEEVILCGATPIQLSAGTGFASYSWNTSPVQTTETITVSAPGAYTVTVTNANNCTGQKTFTVLQSGAATGAVIKVNDFKGNRNSITVTAEGSGDYEYSLDGINYQETPVFENLLSGEYTVYINDKNGCGPPYTDTVYVLDYPKFFTPNGDGVNETWRIPYLNFYPESIVTIYDRYGKIVGSFRGNEAGWDGKFKNKVLPSTDYWFAIQLINGKIITGHFAMVR